MKRLFLCAVILALPALSGFSQQQVLFAANGSISVRLVWDNWSTAANRVDSSNNVAFLWALSGTPLVDTQTGLTQTATNGSSVYNVSMAWTDILTDPNFHLGTNGTSIAVVRTTSIGTYAYNANTAFTLAGAPVSGNITIFVIAWPNFWADPFAAAAVGAPVGWSNPFTYTIATMTSVPFSFSSSTTFDNLRIGEIIPEPTTFALLGLSTASLLIFRRRKQLF